MANMKPLVQVAGRLSELLDTDALKMRHLMLETPTDPGTPPADTLELFASKLAGRVLPAVNNQFNNKACLQPSLWSRKVGYVTTTGNGAIAPVAVGILTPTALGTLTARSIGTTNLLTRIRRAFYASAATAAAFCGHYISSSQFSLGTGAGLGGFFYSFRWAFTDPAEVVGARAFVGLGSGGAAPTNVEPDTLLNYIGIAQLSTDATQLYLVFGGSVAQTPIPLGTDFPPMAGVGANLGVLYELTLFSPSSVNGVCYYRLERVGTSFVAEGLLGPGTAGVTLPSSNAFITHRAWRCNNATLLACGIDIVTLYMETDN